MHPVPAHRRRLVFQFLLAALLGGPLLLTAGCGNPFGESDCFDGIDNDLDGFVDFDDDDCLIVAEFWGIDVDASNTTQVRILGSVLDQPHREILMVAPDGCVDAHCGRFCHLTPGAKATIDCGKHAVVQVPGTWMYASGFWQRMGGGTGTIAKLPDPANIPPQRPLLHGDFLPQLCAFGAPTIPDLMDLYTVRMDFTRPMNPPKAEVVTYLPVVAIKQSGEKGPPQLVSIHPAPVADHLPVHLSDMAVNPTSDGDLSVHILPASDHVADGGLVRFKVFVANHGSTPAMTRAISGSLHDIVFDPARSSPGVLHDGSPVGGAFSYTTPAIQPLSTMRFEVGGQCFPGVPSCVADVSVSGPDPDPDPTDNAALALVKAGAFADVRIERIRSEQNPLIQGVENVFTILVRNRGPLDACTQVTVDVQDLQIISTSAGVVMGNQVQVTTPSIAVHDQFAIELRALSLTGAPLVSVSAQVSVDDPGVTDHDPGNNAQALTDIPVLTELRSCQVLFSTIPVRDWMGGDFPPGQVPGDPDSGFRSFGKPYVSPDGNHWAFQAGVSPNPAGPADSAAVSVAEIGFRAATTVFQTGVSVVPAISDTLASIDAKLSVNDSGCVGLAGARSTASNRVILAACGDNLPGGTGTIDLIAQQGDAIPDLPGLSFSLGRFNEPSIRNDGSVTFLGRITPAATTMDDLLIHIPLVLPVMIFSQEGVTVPDGQAGGGMQKVDEYRAELASQRSGVYETGNGAHLAYRCDLEGPTNVDDVLVVNNTVVLQEGQMFPGLPAPINDPFFGGYFAHNGDWYARANTTDGTAFVVKNGALLHKPGDEITPGGDRWGNFRFVAGDNAGRYVVGGGTTSSSLAIVYYNNVDPPREIARSGDPVDADGNGKFDDGLHMLIANNDIAVMLSGEKLVLPVTIATANSFAATLGSAMVLFELNPQPLPGDFDGDDDVDMKDYQFFMECFGAVVAPEDPCAIFDFNDNGVIDLDDYVAFAELFFGPG